MLEIQTEREEKEVVREWYRCDFCQSNFKIIFTDNEGKRDKDSAGPEFCPRCGKGEEKK